VRPSTIVGQLNKNKSYYFSAIFVVHLCHGAATVDGDH